MRKIAVIGTGYVGLVTGVALASVGHYVTCIDVDENKVRDLNRAVSPIFEPGIEAIIKKKMEEGRLHFTSKYDKAIRESEIVYIAVGTPENEDGTANLDYILQATKQITKYLARDIVVVMKSTVPIGTNELIKELFEKNTAYAVEVVSNPEFLREGSAIYDAFHGDRIVIGSSNEKAANLMEEINKPFGITIFKTDLRSAELIKYASNAFLATKISFINEIANLCDKLGANIEDVADGMGLDRRIGRQFLNAGIGYGGSCFPKDTEALLQISNSVEYDFRILRGVTEVNKKQNFLLIEKAKSVLGPLNDKKIAILGLSFKPNTDDMRSAASIPIIKQLLSEGAQIYAYDPVAMERAKEILPKQVVFSKSMREALTEAEAVFIITEWNEFLELSPNDFFNIMKKAIIFDGRNCFNPNKMKNEGIQYYSIGRPENKKMYKNNLWDTNIQRILKQEEVKVLKPGST